MTAGLGAPAAAPQNGPGQVASMLDRVAQSSGLPQIAKLAAVAHTLGQ